MLEDDILTNGWHWPNFSPEELRCRHTGQQLFVPRFLDRLQALRSALGFALPITSAYRHPTHPAERHRDLPGAHQLGRAVDIAIDGERAFRVVTAAPACGFARIGVSQRAGQPRFLHLDDIQPDEFVHLPSPRLWSY